MAAHPCTSAAQPEARSDQWFAPFRDSFDPLMTRELAAVGVCPGQRVMDVNAGTGSLTAHLAELVGPHGSVTAVDADTSQLRPSSNVRVCQRDLTVQPLPGDPGSFDVITARCLLQQLPAGADILDQMITLLRPGGWLVLGEITYTPPTVYWAPDNAAAELISAAMHTILANLVEHGVYARWANYAPAVLLANGMEHLCIAQRSETWTGGGPGCTLLADTARHLSDMLLKEGVTEDELDRFADLMTNPHVLLRSHQASTIHARKAT